MKSLKSVIQGKYRTTVHNYLYFFNFGTHKDDLPMNVVPFVT